MADYNTKRHREAERNDWKQKRESNVLLTHGYTCEGLVCIKNMRVHLILMFLLLHRYSTSIPEHTDRLSTDDIFSESVTHDTDP